MCGEQTSTQTGNSASYIPDWMSNQTYAIGKDAAKSVYQNPYQGYTGPTEAAFGPTWSTAENAATARSGATDPNFSAGTSALMQGLGLAGTTASAPVSSLMSQYTDAALTPTLDAIQRQAATNNQGLAQQATMSGAFGDTGYGTAKATNDYNTTQAISGATGTAYNQAYQTALSTQQNALAQLLSGVGQASGLGAASNSAQTSLETLLANMGSTQQQAGQTGINTAINVNQQNQMGYLQQLAAAAGVEGALPHNTTGNSTTYNTAPDNTGWGLLGTLLPGVGSGIAQSNLGSTVGGALGNLFGGTSYGGFDYGNADLAAAAQAGVQGGLTFNPTTGTVA